MRWLDVARLRFRSLFQSDRAETELEDEIRFHLESQIEENLARGMTPEEARYAAQRAVGGIAQRKEECRDMRRVQWIENAFHDLRYGTRLLVKSWGLTSTVTLTLALGVGVNIAIFSVLNGWLLRPLPVRAPHQIIVLAAQNQDRRGSQFSYPDFLDFQKQADRFSSVFAYGLPNFGGLSTGGQATQFGFSVVTGNYFEALGVNPAAGRLLLPDESEKTEEPLLIVLGYSFWQRRFGGDRAVVGRQVLFNGRSATIIGVTSPEFHGTFFSADMDGYVSLSAISTQTDRAHRNLVVLGRLKDGLSLRAAQTSSSVIAQRLAQDNPATDRGLTIRVIPEKLARPAPLVTSFVPIIATLFLFLAALVLAVAGMSVGSPSEGAPIYPEGRFISPDRPAPSISFNAIDPTYLETMRVPLVEGRNFRESDSETALPVAIVNRALAHTLWRDDDPIGKRFRLKAGPLVEVIGVARNGQYWFVSPDARPYFYIPVAQHYTSARTLELRSSLPPESLIPAVEEQIRNFAPDLPVIDIRTMRQAVNGLAGLFVFRLAAMLAAVMGILGLTLAVVGVYGVVSFSVSRRAQEIGVRVALGAAPRDILVLVSQLALKLVAAGVLAGLVIAIALSRTMTKLLIGVSAIDPVTYALVAILLAAVAALACWIPARRALRLDPMAALRNE